MGDAFQPIENAFSGFVGGSDPVLGLAGPEAGQTVAGDIAGAVGASPAGVQTAQQVGAIVGGSANVGQQTGAFLSGPGSTLSDVGAGFDTAARTVGSLFIPGVGEAAGAAGDAAGSALSAAPADVVGSTATDALAGGVGATDIGVGAASGGLTAAQAGTAGLAATAPSFGAAAGSVISPTAANALAQSTPDVLAGSSGTTTSLGSVSSPGAFGLTDSDKALPEAPVDVVSPDLSGSATSALSTPAAAPGAAPAVAAPAAAPAASDALQSELTASGINSTGSNAAQQGTVQNLLPDTSSPGLGDKITSALSNFPGKAVDALGDPGTDIKLALGGAGLGLTLASQRNAPAATVAPAAQPLTPTGSVTAPLIQTENTQLAAANAAQLTPPQQAQIDQFVQDQTNQLYQLLANSGVSDPRKDSRFQQGLSNIQQQATAMKVQFLQQDFSTGLSAAGAASSSLNTAAQEQLQLDQDFQTALNNALNAAGNLAGATNSFNLVKAAA